MKDASLVEVTPAVLGVSLLVAVALSFASWCWLLLHHFVVPEPQWLMLVKWMRFAWTPELRWLTLQSLVQGIAPVGFVLYLAGDWGPSDKARVLRGARLVDVKALAARTRLKKGKGAASQVELAGVPIPLGCEPTHFLLAGSTNTGKSTAVDELLATALARGDRCIVVVAGVNYLVRPTTTILAGRSGVGF